MFCLLRDLFIFSCCDLVKFRIYFPFVAQSGYFVSGRDELDIIAVESARIEFFKKRRYEHGLRKRILKDAL